VHELSLTEVYMLSCKLNDEHFSEIIKDGNKSHEAVR
jgi:hypothetical protein